MDVCILSENSYYYIFKNVRAIDAQDGFSTAKQLFPHRRNADEKYVEVKYVSSSFSQTSVFKPLRQPRASMVGANILLLPGAAE